MPQETAENRETGERPVRSRHCMQEQTANMSLSNREDGNVRQTASQETCQLWYGDDRFQITRFDCTEIRFGQQEHVPAGGRQFPAIQLLYALDFCFSSLFIPVSGIERVFFCPFESRCRRYRIVRKINFQGGKKE